MLLFIFEGFLRVKKRIVITGIGVLAPNGIGKDAFWKALKEGNCYMRTTNGPALDFNINGVGMGKELKWPKQDLATLLGWQVCCTRRGGGGR